MIPVGYAIGYGIAVGVSWLLSSGCASYAKDKAEGECQEEPSAGGIEIKSTDPGQPLTYCSPVKISINNVELCGDTGNIGSVTFKLGGKDLSASKVGGGVWTAEYTPNPNEPVSFQPIVAEIEGGGKTAFSSQWLSPNFNYPDIQLGMTGDFNPNVSEGNNIVTYMATTNRSEVPTFVGYPGECTQTDGEPVLTCAFDPYISTSFEMYIKADIPCGEGEETYEKKSLPQTITTWPQIPSYPVNISGSVNPIVCEDSEYTAISSPPEAIDDMTLSWETPYDSGAGNPFVVNPPTIDPFTIFLSAVSILSGTLSTESTATREVYPVYREVPYFGVTFPAAGYNGKPVGIRVFNADSEVEYTLKPGDGGAPVTFPSGTTSPAVMHTYSIPDGGLATFYPKVSAEYWDIIGSPCSKAKVLPYGDLGITIVPGPVPQPSVIVDKNWGPVPLDVNYDATGSYGYDENGDPRVPNDGYLSYEIDCGNSQVISTPTGTCTYNQAGTFPLRVTVSDSFWDTQNTITVEIGPFTGE